MFISHVSHGQLICQNSSHITGHSDEGLVCHIPSSLALFAEFLPLGAPATAKFDENLGLSQASEQGDKMKFSSGVSQSQGGDKQFVIVIQVFEQLTADTTMETVNLEQRDAQGQTV